MQKKNSKLESFLFRTLPEQVYERIRGYESCIVVSEKENKAFKYVILGDEWLYLTENPPRTIQETVSLGDVISVELVNDFPDFLMGDDKRNSQHLAITHWTSEPVRKRSFRKKKSPRDSNSDLHGDRSNASTPMSQISAQELWSDDHGYSSLSSLQYNRPDSRGSSSSAREARMGSISKKKKKGSKTLHTIQSESEDMILKSLKEELEEDILEDLENQSEIGETMNKSGNMNTMRTSTKSARSARSLKSARSNNDAQKSSRPLPNSPLPKTNAFTTTTHKEQTKSDTKHLEAGPLPQKNGLPPDVDDGRESPTTCCCSFTIGKTKVSPFCGSDKKTDQKRLFSASDLSTKPMSEVHIEITSVNGGKDVNSVANQRRSSIHSSMTTLRGQTSRAGTPAQDDFERRSVLSMASVSDFGGSMNRLSLLSVDGSLLEKRRVVLNLYLLSNVSPMLMLIRSAWSNYLLSSTSMLNPGTIDTLKGSMFKGPHAQRGKIDMLFQELKRDLLKPSNDMEQTYLLLNELKMATEKNFALKRLFWKNADLFHFFVKSLQQYLPKSPTGSAGSAKRGDEIEFVLLVMETLCMMFHESEIIPERTQALKAERGRSVVGLLMALTCTPDLPDQSDHDPETLTVDFTKIAMATVFELFLMAKQANWGFSEGNFYNISWMVSTLEEIKHMEKFVSRVIEMVLKMISPTSCDKISPDEAVLLYHQFFILDTFLKYSPKIKTFICNTYMEEFKYFVQPTVVMRKLSQVYPIYYILLDLIENVLKKVMPPGKSSKDKKF